MFLKYFPLITKFTSLKLGTIYLFLHIQSTQTLKVDNLCFFWSFFLPNVQFLLKIGEDLTLMI